MNDIVEVYKAILEEYRKRPITCKWCGIVFKANATHYGRSAYCSPECGTGLHRVLVHNREKRANFA